MKLREKISHTTSFGLTVAAQGAGVSFFGAVDSIKDVIHGDWVTAPGGIMAMHNVHAIEAVAGIFLVSMGISQKRKNAPSQIQPCADITFTSLYFFAALPCAILAAHSSNVLEAARFSWYALTFAVEGIIKVRESKRPKSVGALSPDQALKL